MNRKLRRSATRPSWRERLRHLLLAGGALGLVGCATDSAKPAEPDASQCGNANRDPCICGRPGTSPKAAKACAQEVACVNGGRDWTFTPDGGVACVAKASADAAPQPADAAPQPKDAAPQPTGNPPGFDAGFPLPDASTGNGP